MENNAMNIYGQHMGWSRVRKEKQTKRDKSFYCRYRLKIYTNLLVNSKIIETIFYIDNENYAYQLSFCKYLKILLVGLIFLLPGFFLACFVLKNKQPGHGKSCRAISISEVKFCCFSGSLQLYKANCRYDCNTKIKLALTKSVHRNFLYGALQYLIFYTL